MTSLLIQFFFYQNGSFLKFSSFSCSTPLESCPGCDQNPEIRAWDNTEEKNQMFFPKETLKYTILQTKKLSQEQRVKKGLKKIFIFFFQCENNSQSLVPQKLFLHPNILISCAGYPSIRPMGPPREPLFAFNCIFISTPPPLLRVRFGILRAPIFSKKNAKVITNLF